MTSKLAKYYDATAVGYDTLHKVETNPEHTRAMEVDWPLFGDVSSVLDVGSGTGHSLIWLNQRSKNMRLLGIEPSRRMIDVAKNNIPVAAFQQANAEAIPYGTDSVDVAIATGIMYHVDSPTQVIAEMLRVARIGILISDHNNYAFGGSLTRRLRMALKVYGLLGVATFIKQGFNKQGYSEEDGWWYPYSLFDNYTQIVRMSEQVFIFPTRKPVGNMGNIVFSQGHFAIVGLKNSSPAVHRVAHKVIR